GGGPMASASASGPEGGMSVPAGRREATMAELRLGIQQAAERAPGPLCTRCGAVASEVVERAFKSTPPGVRGGAPQRDVLRRPAPAGGPCAKKVRGACASVRSVPVALPPSRKTGSRDVARPPARGLSDENLTTQVTTPGKPLPGGSRRRLVA